MRQIPARRVAARTNHGVGDRQVVDDDTVRDDCQNVVAETNAVGGEHFLATLQQLNVLQPDAREEIALQPRDLKRSIEIAFGFPGHVDTKPVLEPRSLRGGDRDNEHAEGRQHDECCDPAPSAKRDHSVAPLHIRRPDRC